MIDNPSDINGSHDVTVLNSLHSAYIIYAFLTLYRNKWLTNGIYQRNGRHTRYTYGLGRYPHGT